MKKNWMENDYWKGQKGNGLYKICFYKKTKQGEKLTIFERSDEESADAWVLKMRDGLLSSRLPKGDYGWRIYDDNYNFVKEYILDNKNKE